MAAMMDLVRAIRNARTEYDVEPARRIAAVIAAGENAAFLMGQAAALQALARVDGDQLRVVEHLDARPDKALALVVGGYECYLPLAALVDLDRERERLSGETATLEREVARSEGLLANAGFTAKAPPAVVQKERDKVTDYRERAAKLKERLASLA
jgi:valyl-tRNA synthetase